MEYAIATCLFVFGAIVFFSPRQAVCSLIALLCLVIVPTILFSGMGPFKREGGIIGGIILLGSMPIAYAGGWIAAHFALPSNLLGKVEKKQRRIAGGAIMAFSLVVLAALLM